MKIKHIVDEFKTEDFSEWERVHNRQLQSLWLRKDNSLLKIHVKIDTDDSVCVRFFKFHELGDFSGTNYRITLTDKDLFISTLIINNHETKSVEDLLYLPEYKNYSTESTFFQQSLITDVGDLQFDDIASLIHTRDEVINASIGDIEYVRA